MQYRNGQFVSSGAAVTLQLGFVPDRVKSITTLFWKLLQLLQQLVVLDGSTMF